MMNKSSRDIKAEIPLKEGWRQNKEQKVGGMIFNDCLFRNRHCTCEVAWHGSMTLFVKVEEKFILFLPLGVRYFSYICSNGLF